jgi:hypothetical protein
VVSGPLTKRLLLKVNKVQWLRVCPGSSCLAGTSLSLDRPRRGSRRRGAAEALLSPPPAPPASGTEKQFQKTFAFTQQPGLSWRHSPLHSSPACPGSDAPGRRRRAPAGGENLAKIGERAETLSISICIFNLVPSPPFSSPRLHLQCFSWLLLASRVSIRVFDASREENVCAVHHRDSLGAVKHRRVRPSSRTAQRRTRQLPPGAGHPFPDCIHRRRIKYWGKRDASLNLPINSSVSCTLQQDDLCAKVRCRAPCPLLPPRSKQTRVLARA